MIKGIIGARGGAKIPREKAIRGVPRPMTTAELGPAKIQAKSSIAFTKGPVTSCGQPNIWITTVKASKIAVLVNQRRYIFITSLF
jgi:hypothetical protein